MKEFSISSRGKGFLHCILWEPDEPARGIVQIVHGIAEYAARYDSFARFLNQSGFLVVAEDHMGHGGSLAPGAPPGRFYGGWEAAVDDVHSLLTQTQAQYPALPYFLLGHSMGSFLTRTLLYRYPDEPLAGVILSGTTWQPAASLCAGLALCRSVCRLRGEDRPAPLLRQLIFGSYNNQIEHPETAFDWVCGDRQALAAYLADPLCGFAETAGLDRDMLHGIQMNQSRRNLEKMPKKLPVLFAAGMQDPVGAYGKGVLQAMQAFQKAGMQKVEIQLYAKSRHEILNDTQRQQVYRDMQKWLLANLSGARR